MTRGVRLRRWMRARERRRAAVRRERPAQPERRSREQGGSEGVPRRLWQTVVCGTLFAALVLLKLVMPGNLAAFRGTLAQWLVRDADFTAAFSAVGQAVAAPQRFAESLGEAYIAVFGEGDATEVNGEASLADGAADEPLTAARALPDYASAETLPEGFACSAPLTGAVETSAFGWREDPNTGEEAFHTGLDLAADEGTAFACFADGTVGVVGESVVLGKYLTVAHADGYETLYAHCRRITVSSGQSVARGETLGEVGATGNATGPHLHFELLHGSKYLDPSDYVR